MATKDSKKTPSQSARHFEFNDEKSSKFWEMQVTGDSFSVRYGKVGTAGQTNVKVFADAAAATKHADKLVSEKLGKGYVEQQAGVEQVQLGASKAKKPTVPKSLKGGITADKESSFEPMSILRFENDSSLEEFEGVEGNGYAVYADLDGKNCDGIASLEFAKFEHSGLSQEQERSLSIGNFKNVKKIYLDETHDFRWIYIDNLKSLEAVVVRGSVRVLRINDSPKLKVLDLMRCSRLEAISCDSKKISSLNLDGCVKLTESRVEPLTLRKLSIAQIKKIQSKSRLDGTIYEDMTYTDIDAVLKYINEGQRTASYLGFQDASRVHLFYFDLWEPDNYNTDETRDSSTLGLGGFDNDDLEDCLDFAVGFVKMNISDLEDVSNEEKLRFLKYIADRQGGGFA